MDGYNAAMNLYRQRPEYLAVVMKCVEAHHKQKEIQYSLGFEWSDVGVWPPTKLALLATEYELLKVSYKSNSATCYMVKDIEGVEKALQDIEGKRVAASDKQAVPIKVWLSGDTLQRFRAYLAKEFSDSWDAESLVVGRAVNLFLEKNEDRQSTP